MVISVDGVIGGGVWPRLMRMPDGPPVDVLRCRRLHVTHCLL